MHQLCSRNQNRILLKGVVFTEFILVSISVAFILLVLYKTLYCSFAAWILSG